LEYHRGGGDGNQLEARRNGDVDGKGGGDFSFTTTWAAKRRMAKLREYSRLWYDGLARDEKSSTARWRARAPCTGTHWIAFSRSGSLDLPVAACSEGRT
jgi:hypothetical protein